MNSKIEKVKKLHEELEKLTNKKAIFKESTKASEEIELVDEFDEREKDENEN